MVTDSRTVLGLLPRQQQALSIPFAVVLYEGGNMLCECAALGLRQCLRQVAEPLFDAIWTQSVCVSSLRTVLEAAAELERRSEKWEALVKCGLQPFNPTDLHGKAAPQCILLLSAHYLCNASDRDLLTGQLREAASKYSQFLIVFFADPDEVTFDADENDFQDWLRAFAGFEHKLISLQVISPTFEGGEPISSHDLADSVAIALGADLLLSNSRSPRILSGVDDGHSISLSTFGVKSIQFDPWRAAESFKQRVTATLLKRTALKELDPANELQNPLEANSGSNLDVEFSQRQTFQISSPIDVLNSVSQLSFIVGKEGSVVFRGVGLPDEEQLDAMPEGEWFSALHDSLGLLSRKLNSGFVGSIEGALEVHERNETEYLRTRLAQAFLSAGGNQAALALAVEMERQVREAYLRLPSSSSDDQVASPFEHSLIEMREAVERISTLDQALAKMALRFLPSLAPGLIAWHFQIPFYKLVLIVGGAVGLWGAFQVWSRRRQARAHARNLRNRVLRRIREDTSSVLSGTICNRIIRAGEQLLNSLTSFKKRIEEVQIALSGLAEASVSNQTVARSQTLQRLPDNLDQTERLFSSWWTSESLVRDLENEFCRLVGDNMLEIMTDKRTPCELCQSVEQFALDFCLQRLQTLRLWNFFQEDLLSVASPLIGEKLESILGRLQGRPCVYLQNLVVRDFSSRPGRTSRILVGPRILQPGKLFSDQVASAVLENTMAAIVRVRLSEVVPSLCSEEFQKDSSLRPASTITNGISTVDCVATRVN